MSISAFYILVSNGGRNYVKHDCNPKEGFCSCDAASQVLDTLDKKSVFKYLVVPLYISEK